MEKKDRINRIVAAPGFVIIKKPTIRETMENGLTTWNSTLEFGIGGVIVSLGDIPSFMPHEEMLSYTTAYCPLRALTAGWKKHYSSELEILPNRLKVGDEVRVRTQYWASAREDGFAYEEGGWEYVITPYEAISIRIRDGEVEPLWGHAVVKRVEVPSDESELVVAGAATHYGNIVEVINPGDNARTVDAPTCSIQLTKGDRIFVKEYDLFDVFYKERDPLFIYNKNLANARIRY